MSSPEVRVQEIDLSTRVPGFAGVYGGIVLPTNKGPVDRPQLVTSDSDLLRKFTLTESVPIDGSDAFFSALAFLQKSDKLWVRRCAGAGALYGGADIVAPGSSTTQAENVGFTTGLMNPEYVDVADKKMVIYAQNPGAWNNEVKIKIFRQRPIESVVTTFAGDTQLVGSTSVAGKIVVSEFKIETAQDWQDGEPVRLATAADVLDANGVAITSYRMPAGLNAAGVFYIVKHAEVYDGGTWKSTIRLATSYSKAKAAAVARDASNTTEYEANVVKFTRRSESIVLGAALSQFTSALQFSIATVGAKGWVTGESVYIKAGDGILPTGTPDVLYVIRTGVGTIKLAATKDDALAGIPYAADTSNGTATSIEITEVQGIKILPVKNTKTPNTGLLEVFVGADEENPVETFVFAREPGRKNVDGTNIFLDTLLESSAYIRGKSNVGGDVNPDDTYDAATGRWTLSVTGTELKVQGVALAITGGNDGGLVTDGDMIRASEDFLNKESYPLTVMMDGGYASISYQQQLLSIAETRKDCVAILSTPEAKENASDYLNAIVDFKMSELNPNTSYGALYTPHVKVFDRYNNVERWVAPDGYAAAAISYTAYNYEMWYPVGGFRRGVINVKDTNRRFTKGEMDYLYDNGINPIRFYPNKGIVIWGQKTLSARPSALDRLNVRLMLIVIEPACAVALEDFLFELNDEATRGLVRAMLETYMEGIKARRGVYDYYVVCGDENNSADDIDNYRLNVWLFVKPTKAIEYIPFKVIITSTGMDFGLAAQSV